MGTQSVSYNKSGPPAFWTTAFLPAETRPWWAGAPRRTPSYQYCFPQVGPSLLDAATKGRPVRRSILFLLHTAGSGSFLPLLVGNDSSEPDAIGERRTVLAHRVRNGANTFYTVRSFEILSINFSSGRPLFLEKQFCFSSSGGAAPPAAGLVLAAPTSRPPEWRTRGRKKWAPGRSFSNNPPSSCRSYDCI